MSEIDVGAGATDRTTTRFSGYTRISLANPANATGKITSVEIWAYSALSGVKVATFSRDGNDFTPRSVISLGAVDAGSKQVFTKDAGDNDISMDIEEGDFLGIYYSDGQLEGDISGGSGGYSTVGDQTEAGEQSYTSYPGHEYSLYATGETVSVGSPQVVVSA